MSNWLTAR